MMKFLVLALVVGGVLWWIFGRRRPLPGAGAKRRQAEAEAEQAAEAMVVCAHCGVHLPRGDALSDGTRLYCSDAHRLAGPKAGA